MAGPVSLPEMIGMVDAPYLGDVVVLWVLALKQVREYRLARKTVRCDSVRSPAVNA